MTQLYRVDSTATTNFHRVNRTINSIAAGTRQTFSSFVKPVAGANTYSIYLHCAVDFNNTGVNYHLRIDGNEGFYSAADADMTDIIYGYKRMSSGIYHVWITGTWATTGNKSFWIGVSSKALTETRNYLATVTDSFQMYGMQLATSNGPTGYVETVAATASQAEEGAFFSDTAWLASTAQGTFIIEHDCWSGPLIGSGANTVLAATVPGKTAIAWDGSTSDTVNNGGATTAGGLPTFSGSAVSLLATTGIKNTGHIKSIRFYATRLSVANLQTLTAKSLVSTAAPNTLRTVSPYNRLPAGINTTSGTLLTFTSRFKVSIGANACSELRLDFPNIRWAANTTVGNALNIESVALERETGVAEYVPVYVGGSRSFTVANDAATTVVSDAVLAGSFTGLSQFNANMDFWIRVKGSVSMAGHVIVGARFSNSEANAFSKIYDGGTTSFSPVDSTGPIIYVSGTDQSMLTQGYCPILVGKFVSGDPKTAFAIGDSLLEGTATPETFVKQSSVNLTAAINMAGWTPYLKYARILIDEMGTNEVNAVLDFFSYWAAAKTTYSYDKIMRVGLFPRSTSTDNWVTEANQTIARAYPASFPDLHSLELLKYGAIDYTLDPQSVRGTNKAKWLTNGSSQYSTTDGTHPSVAGQVFLTTEFQPVLAAITVT
jgi:hypothetical protein